MDRLPFLHLGCDARIPHDLGMTKTNVLAILGHPNPDSLNAALWRTYVEAARAEGAQVTAIALSDLDFDPILRAGYGGTQPLEPDLLKLQAAIEACDHLVLFFPVWWAGPPALLKGAFDRVLLPGWAYRYEGAVPIKLLKGRTARVVTTMDAPSWYYRWAYRRAAHRAVVQATLHFVGFSPVQETTYYIVRDRVKSHAERWFKELAASATKDVRAISKKVPRALPVQQAQ